MKKSKLIATLTIFSFLTILTATLFAPTQMVKAVSPVAIIVVGPDGSIFNIDDITQIAPVTGWGGYKSNTKLNSGIYQGVLIETLCEQVGLPLQRYQNVTVQTSGGSGTNTTFNYDQAVNGIDVSPQFTLYDNNTGVAATPTRPVTLIVAYQFENGSALLQSESSRLMIIGPESLLFPGPGLAGVISINITNVSTPPTDAPTSTPTPTEAPTTEPTVQPTISATETPIASPTAEPIHNELPITYIAVAGVAIAVVVVAVVLILHGRKPNPV